MKAFLLSLAFVLISLPLWAQTATIQGKVVEKQNGEIILGATVYLENTDHATATDLDGNYRLENVALGNHTLICEYMGYASQRIRVVLNENNEVQSLDLALVEAGTELDVVEVEVKVYTNTETALLTKQRQAAIVMDGISATQMSKTGDNDAAAAMRRITGVTVEGGKYIYVRGLSDRYSKTTLNGAEIPGLDPNRNTVQMDLFPTNLLDNILVYKTFSPDLYGDFAGGYVDLHTKDFPEQFTFQASASLGYNSLTTFNPNFLSNRRSSLDVLALGARDRALPELVAQHQGRIPTFQSGDGQLLSDLSRSFNNDWTLSRQAAPMQHNLSFSIGNQIKLFNRPLGFVASLMHQQEFTGYNNGQYGIYELTDRMTEASGLTPQLVLADQKGEQSVLWGAMFSSSYKLNNKNRIGLLLMHNQAGNSVARSLSGRKFRDDPDDIFQTQTLSYQQRSLTTAQLQGKHAFSNLELNWQSAYSYSLQNEPDIQYFTNRYQPDMELYFIKPSSDRIPSRFYRNMNQGNWSNRLDVTYSLKQWDGLSTKIKAGAAYLYKQREFREQRYSFAANNTRYQGDLNSYFADSNMVSWNAGENQYAHNGRGLYLIDNLDPANNYDANQQVTAAYAMTDLPLTRRLRLIAGLRMEHTAIRLRSFSEVVLQRYPSVDGQAKLLNNLDFLPSLNMIYDFSERMKLRGSYSRTLARPSFRELAPFASFDVEGGYILVGNPDLQRSLIDNVDLRWEFYPSASELVSVSAFYKHFQNPIERTFNPEQPNGEFTFRNVASAFLYGAEFELRHNLSRWHRALAPFTVATNFSYVYSRTQIDPRELAQMRANDPQAADTRAMFGQSPYAINCLLSYQNQKGTNANLAFNVAGARIAYITIGATPEIYELPRPWLNFNFSQKVYKGLHLTFSANNLLLTQYQEVLQFKGQVYQTQANPLGSVISFGIKYK